MAIKKLLSLAVALFSIGSVAIAQDIEGGLLIGTANYQGDVTEKHITIDRTKPNFGLLGRYYFGPRFNLKGNIYYGFIAGDDKDYSKVVDRDKRNLNFRSGLLDVGIQGELNVLPFISNSKRYKFAPYVFAGISLFNFNPKGDVPTYDAQGNVTKTETYKLKALGTEGQYLDGATKSYSLWQGAVPYGVGIKYSLGNFWNIGFEVGQRLLFTDYLDDVSDKYPDMAKQAAWSQQKFGDDRAVWAASPRDFKKYPYLKKSPGDYNQLSKNPKTGVPYRRGDVKDKDMYVFAGITITKTLRRFSCTNF